MSPGLGIVVVIPCHDEPDPVFTVESLRDCERPRCAVEVLVVVNASGADDDALRARNARGIRALEGWRDARADRDNPSFRLQVLDYPRLDPRHAGVGLARKLGMDAAVARLVAAGNARGVIACLDADCRVDPDYLTALEAHFARWPPADACSIYFEHPLEGPLDPALYRAAGGYELFLRYYRHGLRHARFPHDHYTVGSCMAVRCDAYARHGGMNRRQAGEDFYFLDKLMITGSVSELTTTRVVPGVRVSARTPFGTGRALGARLGEGGPARHAYAPEVFRDLGELIARVDDFWNDAHAVADVMASLPGGVVAFLNAQKFPARHAEMIANTASRGAFEKRFFRWLSAFRGLKLIHHLTRHVYPRRPLAEACLTLLSWQGEPLPRATAAPEAELLALLRARDRAGARLDTPGPRVRLLAV